SLPLQQAEPLRRVMRVDRSGAVRLLRRASATLRGYMFARLARWLSGRRDAAVSPAAPSPQPVAEEPPRLPQPRLVHVAPETPRKRRRRREPGQLPPDVHARRLLHWCQTEGGATGDILAADLLEIYHEQCSYDLLEPLHWQAVAVELRRLL